MAVNLELTLQGLANLTGMMEPMLQATQNQQALMTQVLQTMGERDQGEGRERGLAKGLRRRAITMTSDNEVKLLAHLRLKVDRQDWVK